jgi:hypothetical protein
MENKTTVIEGYMSDGVDLIHNWSSVQEALESGRFEYLWLNYDEDFDDFNPDDLYKCQSVEEMIEMVGFPFELSN